jgi:hypothetical protein
MPTRPFQGDEEAISRRSDWSRTHADPTDLQAWIAMEGDHGSEPLGSPFGHELFTSARKSLFGGLKDEADPAGKLGS